MSYFTLKHGTYLVVFYVLDMSLFLELDYYYCLYCLPFIRFLNVSLYPLCKYKFQLLIFVLTHMKIHRWKDKLRINMNLIFIFFSLLQMSTVSRKL